MSGGKHGFASKSFRLGPLNLNEAGDFLDPNKGGNAVNSRPFPVNSGKYGSFYMEKIKEELAC